MLRDPTNQRTGTVGRGGAVEAKEREYMAFDGLTLCAIPWPVHKNGTGKKRRAWDVSESGKIKPAELERRRFFTAVGLTSFHHPPLHPFYAPACLLCDGESASCFQTNTLSPDKAID